MQPVVQPVVQRVASCIRCFKIMQIVLLDMQHCHLIVGINFLILLVSLIDISVCHILTTMHTSDPYSHHHSSRPQSLFTLDLKHTSSSSLFHHRHLHTHRTDFMDSWPDSLSLARRFCFRFFFHLTTTD